MKPMLLTVLFLTCGLSKSLNSSRFRQVDDMLIYELDNESSFNKYTPRFWDHRVVYYDISPELYHLRYRVKIQEAMNIIYRETGHCIHFIPRYDEKNYVSIRKGNCNSHVGMIGGAQELNLDTTCLNTGDIIHELMHALGYFHEHSRPDRDDYLNIFLENVEENKKHNFIKLSTSQYPYDVTKFEFDFESIMIYGENAFSKNSFPTMRPKDWIFGPEIKNPKTKKHLSRLDVQLVRSTYGCDEI